jgi:HAD superfamily hydrolase (TIGR01509 family)
VNYDHDTVVFDLDGTLVRLAVEWDVVAREVATVLQDHGIEPPDTLWGMLEAADENGAREAVEAVISAHERDGARDSERLPAADTVPDDPVGVCSLNAEEACRIALETHEIDGIAAVVGRDTLATEKPDPEPLLETIDLLDGDPGRTLFVGDSDRDRTTAERAGTDYVDVSEWLRA